MLHILRLLRQEANFHRNSLDRSQNWICYFLEDPVNRHFCHSPQFCFNLIIKLGTCINSCSGICLFNKHWKDMSGRETSAWQLLIKSYSLTFCGTITSWFDGRVYYEKKTYITKTDNNNKQTKTYTAKEILYSLDVSFSRLRKLLAI